MLAVFTFKAPKYGPTPYEVQCSSQTFRLMLMQWDVILDVVLQTAIFICWPLYRLWFVLVGVFNRERIVAYGSQVFLLLEGIDTGLVPWFKCHWISLLPPSGSRCLDSQVSRALFRKSGLLPSEAS